MRRMRDIPWMYWLMVVPAVGGALAVQYWMRSRFPEQPPEDSVAVVKPSFFWPDSSMDHSLSTRSIAAALSGKKTSWMPVEPKLLSPDSTLPIPEFHDSEDEIFPDDDIQLGQDDDGDVALRQRKRYQPKTLSLNSKTEGASAPADGGAESGGASSRPADEGGAADSPAAVWVGQKCTKIEYRGDGPHYTRITQDEWGRVVTAFNGVKGDLLGWLDSYRPGFPDKVAAAMESQMRRLRLERPPARDEPDLTWRGVAILAQDAAGEPVIRMGSGFVKLVIKQPVRARFELARVVAQVWAPCELVKNETASPWDPLLACLGIKETDACGTGSYSEGGWAVSSVLAAAIAPPGCTLPAFQADAQAKCVRKIPLPLVVGQRDVAPERKLALEARR